MTEYPYIPDEILESERAFPPEIEARQDVVFHGTSCAYSAQIESIGFEFQNRPWRSESLLAIAESIEQDLPEQARQIRHWANHPVRLSFAKSSVAACQYAIKGQGGQTLGFVRPIAHRVPDLPEDIGKVLAEVDRMDFCVYAVTLRDIPVTNKQDAMGAWYVTGSVPAEALIGKIVIPRGTSYEQLKKPGLEDLYSAMVQRNSGQV